MKKTLTVLCLMITISVLVYLAAAFITMEFNPAKWEWISRFMCVVVILAVTAASYVSIEPEDLL